MIGFPELPPDFAEIEAFVSHPERHTIGDIEPMQRRLAEIADAYFRDVRRALLAIHRAMFGEIAAPTRQRAALRAARRRAHQSVQARHMRRKGG